MRHIQRFIVWALVMIATDKRASSFRYDGPNILLSGLELAVLSLKSAGYMPIACSILISCQHWGQMRLNADVALH